MPEKSIREMSWIERQHYSLGSKTFRAVILSSIFIGIVSLLIGLGLYTYSLASGYISSSFYLARNAASIATKSKDFNVVELSKTTMDIYRSCSPEEHEKEGTLEYETKFSSVIFNNQDYSQTLSLLKTFYDNSDVFDIYLAMYDKDSSRLVWIVDPDIRGVRFNRTGTSKEVKYEEIEKFMNWDGKGTLYHIGKTEENGWLSTSGVPVKDSNGEIVAFFFADVTLGNVIDGIKSFLLQFSIAMFVIINLIGILMARRIRKRIADPINKLAETAGQYVIDKRNGTMNTDHFSRLNIRTGDEIENLSFMLKDMEKDLNEYETNLTKVTAEKERIGTELNLATRIQADMLPNIYPAFPEKTEFDIYATMNPAKEVGGDFYDFFLIDDNHLGIVMADVSGKGIPAALFMMASKILIQNHAMMGKSPKDVLEDINNQICSSNREEMFVTVWFGIMDLETGVIRAANAGHEFPVLKRPGGRFDLIKDKHGFVIGGMAGMKYKEYEIQMEPGSKLFLYTDGVPEATNKDNVLFGTDRMLESLNGILDGTTVQTLDKMKHSLTEFVGDAPQFDDVTMLCLVYNGTEQKGDNEMKEMTIEATVENIPQVTAFVDEELEKFDCPMKAQAQIDVAIDELFGNIAHYAYDPKTGPATVRVEVEKEPLRVVITFIDHGKPYDPLSKEDPDVTLAAEEREIGGLGIFLVKKTMDDVVYEYSNGHNILKIVKRI